MASQAKFTEMLSQFSSVNVPKYKPPPPPKKTRQKINAQYSQLDVQSVDVSTSTNKCPETTEVDTAKSEKNNEYDWSDEDIDGVELDALLSQYDIPPEPAAQSKARPLSQIEESIAQSRPNSKNTLPFETASDKTVKKPESKPTSFTKHILKKEEAEEQAYTSNTRVVLAPKKGPRVEKSKVKRGAESNCSNPIDILDPIFDVPLILKTEKETKFGTTRDFESKQELAKTETLLSEMYAEIMNVPSYSQRLCKIKNIHQHWESKSIDSLERWFPEERAPSARLQLVFLNSICSANMLNQTKTQDTKISLSYYADSPDLEGPLVLQQIAQVCDTAAIRHDYFTFGPIVCASVKFISNILLLPGSAHLDTCYWILRRCADIRPVPCVLLSLLDVAHQILVSNPKLLNGVFAHGCNEGSECFLAKLCCKVISIFSFEETVKASQTDEFFKELKESSLQKENYKVVLAVKLCDFMTSLHFAPSFKLPSCVFLARSAECLRSIFRLTSKIVISLSIVRRKDHDCHSLYGKFALVMSWMATNCEQFKRIVFDLHAELYCFLAKQAKQSQEGLVDAAIKNLISTYSSWRTEVLDAQEVMTGTGQRLSSVAETATPSSSERSVSDLRETRAGKRKNGCQIIATHKKSKLSLK